jgi:hypothetical protein
MLTSFDELFFKKKPVEKIKRKTEPGAQFFSFTKEAWLCLSRNHNRASRGSKTVPLVEGKKKKTCFFSVFERHARASRESTTVHLAEAKPCLSRKEKKTENTFFPVSRASRKSTTVPLAEAKPCLSRKEK